MLAEEWYREEQWFPRFVGALLGGISAALAGLLIAKRPPGWGKQLATGAGGVLGLTGALAPMRTTVAPDGITVSFGLPGWVRFHIAAGEVRAVEPVSYHPIQEYGGWGIRFSLDGTRAYTARGSQGVRVETARRTFLIGTQRPHELARAITRVITAKTA